MTEQNVCQFCGAVLKDADICEFDGKILCEHCLTERTTLCDCCLDRIWLDEAEGNHRLTLCRYCYENNYINCARCGDLIHNDDAHYDDDNDEPYLKSRRLYVNDITNETEER